MAGEHIDISSESADLKGGAAPQVGGGTNDHRFLGVHFVCCDVYSRIYLNHHQRAYVGNCPKCARQVRFRISPDGTDARFFRVS